MWTKILSSWTRRKNSEKPPPSSSLNPTCFKLSAVTLKYPNSDKVFKVYFIWNLTVTDLVTPKFPNSATRTCYLRLIFWNQNWKKLATCILNRINFVKSQIVTPFKCWIQVIKPLIIYESQITNFCRILVCRIHAVISSFCIFLNCAQNAFHAKIVTFEHGTLSNMKCAIPIPNRPIGKFVLTILLGLRLFRDLRTGWLQIHTGVQFLIPSLYLQIVRFLWLYSTLIDFIISS